MIYCTGKIDHTKNKKLFPLFSCKSFVLSRAGIWVRILSKGTLVR